MSSIEKHALKIANDIENHYLQMINICLFAMSSHSNNVKESVFCLCKLLRYASICDITPEVLRLARSNKDESICNMKKAITSIFQSLGYTTETSSDIFKAMQAHGYPRCCQLIENTPSSRELLFCFAWLLHSCKIVEVVKNKMLCLPNPMECYLNLKSEQNKRNQDNILKQPFAFGVDAHMTGDLFQSLSPCDQSNYISWLMGRIEIDFYRLKAVSANNSKLTARISSKIFKESVRQRKHFFSNIDELLLIKQPHLTKTCEQELEDKVQVLNVYIKWKENEDKFWEWMYEALDENVEILEDTEFSKNDCGLYMEALKCSDVNKGLTELCEKLTELKSSLFEKQKIWLSSIKQEPSKLSKVRLEQKHEVQGDVAALFEMKKGNLRLVPRNYFSTKKDCCSIKSETELYNYEFCKLRKELESCQQLWSEELTLVANKLLDQSAILLHFPSS